MFDNGSFLRRRKRFKRQNSLAFSPYEAANSTRNQLFPMPQADLSVFFQQPALFPQLGMPLPQTPTFGPNLAALLRNYDLSQLASLMGPCLAGVPNASCLLQPGGNGALTPPNGVLSASEVQAFRHMAMNSMMHNSAAPIDHEELRKMAAEPSTSAEQNDCAAEKKNGKKAFMIDSIIGKDNSAVVHLPSDASDNNNGGLMNVNVLVDQLNFDYSKLRSLVQQGLPQESLLQLVK